MKTLWIVAATFTSASILVPTVAEAQTVESVRVGYSDLNLANEAGQERLSRRIAMAARSVCGFEDPRQLELAAAVNQCREQAIAGAQPAFDAAVAAATRRGTVTVTSAGSLTVSAQ